MRNRYSKICEKSTSQDPLKTHTGRFLHQVYNGDKFQMELLGEKEQNTPNHNTNLLQYDSYKRNVLIF